MAREPTAVEIASFDTIHKVCVWCGVDDPTELALAEVVGLASTETEHPRVLGVTSVADYGAVVAAVRIGVGDSALPPSLIQKGKMTLVHFVCQLVAGTRLTTAKQEAHDLAAHQRALDLASVAQLGTGSTPTVGAGQQSGAVQIGAQMVRKTSMKVLDQHNEQDIQSLSSTDLAAMFETYHTAMGGSSQDPMRERPLAEIEPTSDQLTALNASLHAGSCWVDFSPFGPYGERSKREREFTALVLNAEGKLTRTKLFGPATFEGWLNAWKVFKTAMIMCGASRSTSLDVYEDGIRRAALRYGQSAWGLLYQADHRARLEHLERVKRDAELLHAQAVAAGPAAAAICPYNPQMPWPYCFRMLANDSEFWRNQFTEPALLIAAKVSRQDAYLEGDAVIASQPFGIDMPLAGTGSASSAHADAPSKRGAKRQADDAPQKKNTHHKVTDGKFTHNRAGFPLCADFNAGTCDRETQAGKGTSQRCAKDKHSVHQCHNCLGKHPASSNMCQGNTTEKQPFKGGSGKGRGKGKAGKRY